MRCAILHYHELALKGRNRPYFERRLVRHLRLLLRDLHIVGVAPLQGRIRVGLADDTPWEPVRDRLRRVFGLSHFSLALGVPLRLTDNLDALKVTAARAVAGLDFATFRVTAKRADKRFPFTSMDAEREIGAHLCAVTGKRVNLQTPNLTVAVELLTPESYVSVRRDAGPGGLPVGVSGRVACLLSGGIDSPVAAYRMMKRGCRCVFVHFHGRPYVSRASEEKVREIVQHLTPYQLDSRLYLVPFGDIQRQIVLGSPAAYRIVLYRRMMVRIAEELARKDRCWALVTGDSLGQVASQTPENLGVIEEAAQVPILRPLIGMDKLEISDQAQRIGTFETSIEPDQDCCRLFLPPHPSTRTGLEDIRKVERGFDLSALVKRGLEHAELAEYHFPPQ